jgi:hypothetical protein
MRCLPKVNRKRVQGKSWDTLVVVSLLLAFTSAVPTGCAGWFARTEPPLREATVEQLRELLRQREAAVKTMKGLFRAQIKGSGIPIAQRVEGAMFYRRPHSLRLQGFNHMGGQIFDFLLVEDLYRLRLPSLGRVYSGRLEELERVGKIAIPFKLSLWAMDGAVGIASVSGGEQVALSEEGDRYRLDILPSMESEMEGNGKPIRRLWFERRFLQVVQEDLVTRSGIVEATIRFEDFRPVSASVINVADSEDASRTVEPVLKPFKVTTQDGQGEGTLQLIFHEIIPNPDLKPEELALNLDREGARQ